MSRYTDLTPRMKPVSPRRSSIVSVLDVGTSKVVCLIARLEPAGDSDLLRGRTHRAQIIGIGHQRSRGLKAGAVVDLDAAEQSIRQAVDAAERMARVEIRSVIVSTTGGRLGSRSLSAEVGLRGESVSSGDINRAFGAASVNAVMPQRTILHALETGFSLDGARGIRDPQGMIGRKLGVDMHVVTSDEYAVRNLMLAVERCHLEVEAVVAGPYAAGLSVVVDDEAEMGVAVVDFGAGTTSVGVFHGGALVHTDAVAVGGNHITMDIARGFTTTLSHAERLKTLYGSTIASASDDRETIAVESVDDEDRNAVHHVPKSHLVRVIKPRVEEILEFVRDRLNAAGLGGVMNRRIVLTGGTAQLLGMPDLARRILSKQVRVGRPLGVQGLPDAMKGPAFAATIGLLVYPQVAGLERFEPVEGSYLATGTDGYLHRMGRWLKESF